MTKLPFHALFSAGAVALLLAGCGGGGDNGPLSGDFSNEPRASGRAANVTVAQAVNTSLNGGYATAEVFLNDVEKRQDIGEPEYCKQRFSNLPKSANPQFVMSGDFRYKPGTTEMTVAFVSINSIEFKTTGPAGAAVNRAGNVINFTNAVFTSTDVGGPTMGQTLILSGQLPIRAENKPEGC